MSTRRGLRERDADAVGLGPGAHEVDEARRRGEPVVQVVRPDRRDLVRRGEVGGVHQHRRPDVDDRRGRRDPLAVDRDRLGPGEPQLLDDGPHVARADEVVVLARVARDRPWSESSSWSTMPVPVSGISPAAMRACWSWSLSSRTSAAEPWPAALDSPICARSSRIRSLSSSCWAWSRSRSRPAASVPASCSGRAGPRRRAGRR